jgi:putative two-component system response regulator
MFLDTLLHAKILIVDDDVHNIRLLQDILHVNGYTHVTGVNDPRGVISLFIEEELDLIILDLNMPHPNGFELLAMMQPLVDETDYLPVMVVTAEHSYEARRQALTNGASDFLTKPFIADEVNVRITNLLRLRHRTILLKDQVRQRTQELEQYQLELKEAQLETIMRLARAAEHRDDETGKHTQRVGLMCAMLARMLGWSEHEIQSLHFAAPLHDVGKIGIPDSILLKPGKFTETEYKIMQRHARIGAQLLAGGHSDVIQTAERIALTHHERWNGQGYPLGLKGEDIAIEGRILAVVDVFDALTHERPYKPAWPLEDALEELKIQQGKQFDPEIVECFLSLPEDQLAQVCH